MGAVLTPCGRICGQCVRVADRAHLELELSRADGPCHRFRVAGGLRFNMWLDALQARAVALHAAPLHVAQRVHPACSPSELTPPVPPQRAHAAAIGRPRAPTLHTSDIAHSAAL